MGQSISGKKGAKKGEGWKFQVYFDPEADQQLGKYYNISDDKLIANMTALIDASEAIENIWVYKSPLGGWQLTQVLFNHQFVILETSAWWWSIEKNNEEIAIQRSKKPKWVLNHLKREARNTPVVVMSRDKGKKYMRDLLKFLYKKNELCKNYDWIDDNCQDFAKRIFDAFAAKKCHGIVMGAD